MSAKTQRQAQVDALLDQIGAPPKSKRYEATCLKCGTVHKHYATVERCARSHGGGRIEVRLTW
jgi:hypothetical protein